ncbi:glucose-6-phosphate dehydrogenase [Paenibacillus thermotolerans]|uniref:glucose-6-phosphate dehydrogenase n=1 Tax=Paenibacillus thermotolerans TaxID=3027807 RepID=UPI0023682926|nr:MULTISPECIES: glucose-6-phosphate dehydrogenase [unclassified Paenibacillus]
MEPATIILFGATGDLAKRKIYPALYNLFLDGKLPQPFSLIGLGRREWTDETFQANVEKSLREFSRRDPEDSEKVRAFLSAFRYNVLDIGRQDDYRKLLERVEHREAELRLPSNRLFYLSVGPEFFETIAVNIQESGLGSVQGWKRLVIEKPFGHDLKSARELNRTLSQAFTEQQIFRIDHYLGKPVVQRMESLQQANPVIQAIWTNRYIANVQIIANESIGVEERSGYYDHVGAIRDMFQNHLLQLMMMTAIHFPGSSTAENVRFQKKSIMEAVEPIPKERMESRVIRGQYAAGTVHGKPVPGYRSEPGIAPDSQTDTFIAAKLHIDNGFWRGVPFYIRTGKRMKEKLTKIVVEFKEPLKQVSSPNDGHGRIAPNLLVFEIGPKESITLQLNTKQPGYDGAFKPIHIDLHERPSQSPEAYENLIHDALRGDATFFAHWDEVELSWQWVQPILDAFEENAVPLIPYAAGTYGPAEADALLSEDGFHWWLDERAANAGNADKKIEKREKEGEPYAYHANY